MICVLDSKQFWGNWTQVTNREARVRRFNYVQSGDSGYGGQKMLKIENKVG